ncbi:MAG: inositol monophosphatase [Patescibacteria group bacterium]
MSKRLIIAIEAAKIGAKHALKYFDKGIKTEIKKDSTVVTIADRETEDVIKSHILGYYPTAKFVAEESGGSIHEREFWVIDPIDGTRSFSRGIPTWCVIVSFCKDNDVLLSAVYYPHDDTVFYAEKGKGAFENKKRLNVSRINNFSEAYFGFGSPRHFKNKEAIIDLLSSAGSTRSWEATYSACMVVAGKMDAHLDGFGKIWDLAPFKVMIEEAGGKITRLDGSPWTLEGSGAIISNGLLHDEVLAIVNKRK